jgi:hypothetical protein
MKKLLIPAMLLAAACSYGALTQATGDRLTDYTNWFAPEFAVASDANYVGVPYPRPSLLYPQGRPTATSMDTVNRDWTGWLPNWGGTALGGPIIGVPENTGLVTKVEFAFLGETAGWWDDIGYMLNGVEYLLADGIQTVNTPNRDFGDFYEITLAEGDTLDFFITGSGIFTQDGAITTGASGGKFFALDETMNSPASAMAQSYYGTLSPLTNTRSVNPLVSLSDQGFTVMGFEDIRLGMHSDRDYNDLIFAFRSGDLLPDAPVPEPSTYGLIGAIALLGIAGYRRFKKV